MEFFRGDDPRRSGTIARDKFGRCLLVTGFRLSPVELDVREREKIGSSKKLSGITFVRNTVLIILKYERGVSYMRKPPSPPPKRLSTFQTLPTW